MRFQFTFPPLKFLQQMFERLGLPLSERGGINLVRLRTKSGSTAGRNRTKPKGRCLKKGSAIAKKKPAHDRKRAGAHAEEGKHASSGKPRVRRCACLEGSWLPRCTATGLKGPVPHYYTKGSGRASDGQGSGFRGMERATRVYATL